MNKISQKWELNLQNYDDQTIQQLQELESKQLEEKKKMEQEFEEMLENIPVHVSSETLKLKKAEEELAKQGK